MKLYDIQDSMRRTGRTTRMIEEALRLARDGRAVYVVSRDHRKLQQHFDAVIPGGAIKCEPKVPLGFDWTLMRSPGSHPNCVWLVDHYVIEADDRFAAMFEAMTKFDLPATEGGA